MEFPDWAKLPGTLLPGGYEVEQVLSGSERSASFRIRVLGDRFTTAVGEFFAPGTLPKEQVELWLAASALRHPNVSPPLTAGAHNGCPYFVEVQPDETLDAVIGERPLTADEAKEVTRSLAEGLIYLHASGYAHGHLRPSSVAAIGHRISLRLQGIRQMNAPLSPGEDASAPGDVRRLGQTVFQVLTQKADPSTESIEALPSPFNAIVARCLDPNPETRCSLSNVLSMLRGQGLPVVPKEKPVIQTPVPEPPPVRAEEAVAPQIPLSQAPVVAPPPRKEPERPAVAAPLDLPVFPREPKGPSRPQWWFYVPIAAILVAAALLWGLRPKHVAQKPIQTTPAWPSREVGPAPAKSSGSTAPPAAASVQPPQTAPPQPVQSSEPSQKHGDVWHVITYTFDREADAQKRADVINQRHPNLHAGVFSPSGGSPYLVTLGGGMTRPEAEQLRRKARSSGLPRDTYIQNYQH